MSRWIIVVVAIVLFVPTSDARADTVHPAVWDVRSLVYFANRHDRLWPYVQERIEEARRKVSADADAQALRDLEYDLFMKWGAWRERDGGTAAIGIYTKALETDLSPERKAGARAKVVTLQLAEAKRLLSAGGDLSPALRRVEFVLALEHLTDANRSDAEDLRFDIESDTANRLLESGDLTQGYDQLEAIVARYEGIRSPRVDAARQRLRELDRTTGLVTVVIVEVSKSLEKATSEFVGNHLLLPPRLRVHEVRDGTVAEKPAGEVVIGDAKRVAIRVGTGDSRQFVLVVPFPDSPRPDLHMPVSLERRRAVLEIPDRIPERMAFIPDGPQGPFFIGLFEVSAKEWNAYSRTNGEKPLPGPEDLPARNVTMRQVRRFLTHVGGVLPTAEEWRLAALGRDGRKLPWGTGDVAKMAHLNDWDADGPEAVTTRPDSASPYGLHHVLGNVWELVEGGFAMGGSWVTPYPLELTYRRADGRTAKWRPDLLGDPRPLEPAKERLDGERRRKWKEALYDDPEAARVNQGGIGLRLVIRIGR